MTHLQSFGNHNTISFYYNIVIVGICCPHEMLKANSACTLSSSKKSFISILFMIDKLINNQESIAWQIIPHQAHNNLSYL